MKRRVNFAKTLLSVTLCLMLVLGCMPAVVSADTPTVVDNFADLQTAMKTSGTVTLTQNVTAPVANGLLTVPNGATVVLNLGDKTVTAAEGRNFIISVEEGGALTIAATTGGIINNNEYGYSLYNMGTIVINGGEYVGEFRNGAYTNTDASATINAGTFKACPEDYYSIANCAEMVINDATVNDWISTSGGFTMNDGKVENFAAVSADQSVPPVSTVIAGGEIQSMSVYSDNGAVTANNVEITGGTVEELDVTVETGASVQNQLEIGGGASFGFDLSAPEYADYVAASHTTSSYKDGDGTTKYLVVSAGNVAKNSATSQGYADLQTAVNEAQAGEQIVLLGDVVLHQPLTVTKSITLNGDGHSIVYDGTDRAIEIPNSATEELEVQISTLTVIAPHAQRGINYNDDGEFSLSEVTVKGTDTNPPTYAVNLPGKSSGANVTIEDCDLTGNIALNVWGKNAAVTATDTAFTSIDKATYEDYAAIVLNNDGVTSAENTDITVTGGSITALNENGDPSNATINATATGTITVSNTTVVNGVSVKNVAVVRYDNGTAYGFTDLQEAIAKAIEDGRAVDLLANVTASEIITIDGAVTINGNGFTLTSSAGRAINVDTTEEVVINDLTILGITGCERGINVINKAGLTQLNNVTISGESHYAVHIATSAGAAEVEINDSSLTGYAAIAVYGEGASVTVIDSLLVGINAWADNGSNDFSTVAVGADDVTVSVTGDSKITAESTEGKAQQSIFGSIAESSSNAQIVLDAELETKGTAVIVGFDPADDISLAVRSEYADELLAEGFATQSYAGAQGLVGLDNDKTVYTVTYKVGDDTVATFNVVEGEDVANVPTIPAKDGYTAAWDHDGKNVTGDLVINAVYTVPPLGDRATMTWITLFFVGLIGLVACTKKRSVVVR